MAVVKNTHVDIETPRFSFCQKGQATQQSFNVGIVFISFVSHIIIHRKYRIHGRIAPRRLNITIAENHHKKHGTNRLPSELCYDPSFVTHTTVECMKV